MTPLTGSALEPLVEHAWRAIERCGACEVTFELAGATIRLVGAGPVLLDRIAPAFAHLPAPTAAPDRVDLTVLLFDSSSSGVPLPDLEPVGLAVGDPVTPIVHDGGRSFVFHAYEGAVSHLDLAQRTAVYAVEDGARLPPWERACPLRAILSWWFQARGSLLVHSASVGQGDAALLIAGVGGSGKSTTALACLTAGWTYLGDDYVLIDLEAEPTVWSVYGSAKLAAEHLALVPGLLAPSPAEPHDPADAKAVGWPLAAHPSAAVPRAEIRAVVLPGVRAGEPPRVEPVSAARALLALGPATMLQTPSDAQDVLSIAADLARRVPAYRLALGTDMLSVPTLLEPLLARSGSQA